MKTISKLIANGETRSLASAYIVPIDKTTSEAVNDTIGIDSEGSLYIAKSGKWETLQKAGAIVELITLLPAATKDAVGLLTYLEKDGKLYYCKQESSGTYSWVPVNSGAPVINSDNNGGFIPSFS